MSVSLEAGGAADNILCFTFNSAGSLWFSKHSTIPVILNVVRTVFTFGIEGDDGINARLPEKWKTKGTLVQLTLCCSSHSAELHFSELPVLSTVCSCEIQRCALAAVSYSMAQAHMAACQALRPGSNWHQAHLHDFVVVSQISSSGDTRLMGLLLIYREDNLGCLFQGKINFGYGNSFAFSTQLRVFNISVRVHWKKKGISS